MGKVDLCKEKIGWGKSKMYLESNKGHNITLNGQPSMELDEAKAGSIIKLHPLDFPGIKPKLLISKGEAVLKGQPIYFDKNNPDIMFTAFAAGTISNIVYGNKRSIQSIEIKIRDNQDEINFIKNESSKLKDLEKEKIQNIICTSGLWPCIRRRPFSKIAIPDKKPNSIFITTQSTAPYAPRLKVILDFINIEELQVGINMLSQLTNAPLNMVIPDHEQYPLLKNLANITLHTFAGPHPAGNVGYHISKIAPIANKDDHIWYISLEDTVSIGKLFLTGEANYNKIITVGGSSSGNDNKHLVVTRGVVISDILKNNINLEYRIISGDILSGSTAKRDQAIGFYHNTISLVPDVVKREFIGWLRPGLNKYSLSRTFLSSMISKRPKNLSTAMNGGTRTIIPLGLIEKMSNLDIMPTMLLKSIIARDIEMMEALGIYECSPEDFSLCAFIDISKIDIMSIVQEGLEYAEKDG